MRALGIDPGIHGAAALFSTASPRTVKVFDFPTFNDLSLKLIDTVELAHWIEELDPDVAVIERVTPMPSIPDAKGNRRGMGATSAFHFGVGVGSLITTVRLCRLNYKLRVPQEWKKVYGLKGPDKEPSRLKAIELFPDAAAMFARVKDHQRAEAALIARFAAINVDWQSNALDA